MPYSKKEKKLHRSLKKQYGKEKGEQVYHAMARSGKHGKIFSARTKKKTNNPHAVAGNSYSMNTDGCTVSRQDYPKAF